MKFFLKLLIKAGVTLAIVFFSYKFILTNGSGGFQIPTLSDLKDDASQGISGLGNAVTEKDVTVYQWVDENGVTQYGGTPPTGVGEYKQKDIRANTNIMSAYKAPEKEEKAVQRSRVSSVGSLYSPTGIKNLMDDAKGTTEQMNERSKEQEKALNDIMSRMNTKQ